MGRPGPGLSTSPAPPLCFVRSYPASESQLNCCFTWKVIPDFFMISEEKKCHGLLHYLMFLVSEQLLNTSCESPVDVT